MQREIDQRRGQYRDHQRQPEQVARETVHRGAQRRLVNHGFNELRATGRGPDHADGLVAGLQHGLDRIDDRRPHRHGAHVDVMIDGRGQIGTGEQPALLSHLDRHRAGADAAENLPRQRIRHHAGGRGIQHQRGGIGCRQPVVEPVHPEVGDRGHVDQDFRQDHQRNRQQQQLAGQAEPARRLRPRPFGKWLIYGHGHASYLRWLMFSGCGLPGSRSNYSSIMSAVPHLARKPGSAEKSPRLPDMRCQMHRFNVGLRHHALAGCGER